jgi:hypothetical protein
MIMSDGMTVIINDGMTMATGTIFMVLQVRSLGPAFRSLQSAMVSIGW